MDAVGLDEYIALPRILCLSPIDIVTLALGTFPRSDTEAGRPNEKFDGIAEIRWDARLVGAHSQTVRPSK
jgi:hypothetical protein